MRSRASITFCFRTAYSESNWGAVETVSEQLFVSPAEKEEEEGCGVGSSDFDIFLEIQ